MFTVHSQIQIYCAVWKSSDFNTQHKSHSFLLPLTRLLTVPIDAKNNKQFHEYTVHSIRRTWNTVKFETNSHRICVRENETEIWISQHYEFTDSTNRTHKKCSRITDLPSHSLAQHWIFLLLTFFGQFSCESNDLCDSKCTAMRPAFSCKCFFSNINAELLPMCYFALKSAAEFLSRFTQVGLILTKNAFSLNWLRLNFTSPSMITKMPFDERSPTRMRNIHFKIVLFR